MASTSVSSSLSPSEKDLKDALISLKSTHPNLGILKIHALLLEAHPEWAVSEKRTRKTLQSEGLVLQSSTEPSAKSANVFPSSKLIPNLDVAKYNAKLQVKHFSKKKGKGLVAREKIVAGEPLWKEDPYIIAAEWEIYDLQRMGQACSFCTTPFSSSTTTSLLTNCPASSSSSYCPARFCNRLCRDRSARTHPLLCPAQNPASVPLMNWVRETQWIALHALACMTGRVMILCQDPKVADEEWRIVSSFATLSMEDRAKYHYDSAEPDPQAWRKAFGLYMQAFKEPEAPIDQKKLARIIKKPVKAEISQGLFQYDAFLRNLGKMNLNLEAHGGLYVLHSHLNHSCDPNVSIRHLDQRVVLSRITAIAKRDIAPGEELSITYVNPVLPVRARQQELKGWGFGKCACSRCLDEERNLVDSDEKRDGGAGDQGDGLDMADLEKELKAGLGLM
ncbi:hypothetical protein GYMLUDRAFT_229170 [Collybiopsis luxurians FD-317 M1]|uniref:Histone-lysine N-methyltransferase SET5 n=1 Tax=Collybiopsis luxurians FD-317 M1 TaxID=944289 RepID=A0A0D0BQY3_9AGAR|nr:hypothetical protein GYMLUDRAFT_229170 [Collybiopsis luxurians FD-317 M1]